MSKPRSLRMGIVAVFAGLLAFFGAASLSAKSRPASLYGRCHASNCSCFAFQGSGYTCTRGGCGHHYDRHY